MIQTEAKVVSVSEPIRGLGRPSGRDIERSFIITFECPEIALTAMPGQFVMVNCGDAEHVLPRPISINRAEGGKLSLYAAVLENGTGTQWLSGRVPGDTVKILGPLGNGFNLDGKTRKIMLVAGGMGIAPLVFLAEKALKDGIGVVLLYGIPGKDRYPVEEVLPRAECVIATEDGAEGYKGFVTDLIGRHIDEVDQVFICGPSAMYETVWRKRAGLLKGKPAFVSLETRMACGRGICYGCTIQTKNGSRRVCEDGPVFSLDEVMSRQ